MVNIQLLYKHNLHFLRNKAQGFLLNYSMSETDLLYIFNESITLEKLHCALKWSLTSSANYIGKETKNCSSGWRSKFQVYRSQIDVCIRYLNFRKKMPSIPAHGPSSSGLGVTFKAHTPISFRPLKTIVNCSEELRKLTYTYVHQIPSLGTDKWFL